MKATPYLRPAADNNKEKVIGIVLNALNDCLDRFGE